MRCAAYAVKLTMRGNHTRWMTNSFWAACQIQAARFANPWDAATRGGSMMLRHPRRFVGVEIVKLVSPACRCRECA